MWAELRMISQQASESPRVALLKSVTHALFEGNIKR